jgi:hypothetical protein
MKKAIAGYAIAFLLFIANSHQLDNNQSAEAIPIESLR